MHYTHFGKPADVFKHSNLCEILAREAPEVYVETNSAYASYSLQKSEEQEYGVYHFLDKANQEEKLINSLYYKYENSAIAHNCYLGSPGLAISILEKKTRRFFFFDIEQVALNDVRLFAQERGVSERVEVRNQDSISGTMELLPELPVNTLLHIDPYLIHERGVHGYTYLDVFTRATDLGLKCVLWYGFNTLKEKKELNTYISDSLSDSKGKNLYGVEWIMNTIHSTDISCNPGISGSGLLTSNLSTASLCSLSQLTSSLEKIYEGTCYKERDGGYYKELIINTSIRK